MARIAAFVAVILGTVLVAMLGGGAAAQWDTQVAGDGVRPMAIRVTLSGDERRTRFRLDLSRSLEASIHTLGDPDRVVIDMPDVLFKLPSAAGHSGRGLVSAYRYGLFAAGKSRFVIDTTGPVLIENFVRADASGKEPAHIAFDLIRMEGGAEQPLRPATPKGHEPDLRGARFDDSRTPGKGRSGLPVIVIDPGHGGLDPGTVAGANVAEKNVVLAIAQQLKAALTAKRRYDVHMTRSTDVFVSLNERLRLSQELAANLFVSLHADAVPERDAGQNVRGASVYTLSERASDDVARRLAEKENASDTLAGLDSAPAAGEDHLREILIDLMRQETSNFSAEFRLLLLEKLKGRIGLARDPQRAAAFKVLRQADTPAVLVELGYMSNAEDRGRLTSPEWHKQVATALAEAIDAYFSKRLAGAPR